MKLHIRIGNLQRRANDSVSEKYIKMAVYAASVSNVKRRTGRGGVKSKVMVSQPESYSHLRIK